MKARWILTIGLLALLGIATPFVVRFAESEVEEPAPQPQRPMPARAMAYADRDPERDVAAERTEAAPPERAMRRLLVSVIDEHGDPVVGAVVHHEVHSADDEAVTASRSETITDAKGEATIAIEEAAPDARCAVVARRGELHGESDVAPFDDRVLIELQRDLTLTIEAMDSLGRPRPGLVLYMYAWNVSRRFGQCGRDLWTPRTDVDGRVRLEHLQSLLQIRPGVVAGSIVIGYELHGEGAAHRSIDIRELTGSDTVRLVVPDSGSIVIHPTDAQGQAVPAATLLDDGGQTWMFRRPSWREDAWWFDDLPLHGRWTAVLRTAGAPEIRVPVVGPMSAGEVVRIDVPLAVREWWFEGKLTRSDGVAVREGGEVRWRCPELALDEALSITSGGTLGRVGGAYPAAVSRVTRIEITVESPFAKPRTFSFTGPFAPGTHDLGELVVEPRKSEQMLVSLELRCEGHTITNGAQVRLVDAEGHELEGMLQRRIDGRIEVRGPVPSIPVFADCRHPDCVEALVPITPGARAVVDLRRASILRLSVVPPDVPRRQLWVELQPLDGPADPVSVNLAERSGGFRLQSPKTGRHRLSITAGGQVVHEAELSLHAGENRWPADGTRLDLRGRVRTFAIVARSSDPPTSPYDFGLLDVGSLLIDAGGALPAGFERPDRSAAFYSTPRSSDLLLCAPGHVPLRIANVRGDVDVTLPRMTKLEVENVTGDAATFRIRIVEDAVADPVLRAFDTDNPHRPEMDVDPAIDASQLWFASGTVLDIAMVRDGRLGPMQRVTVGPASPQRVTIR